MSKERYIERSFPIVQLNPLSVRERNAFKPIYKMHKWFARRSSSIFRAILLAAALPYEDDDGQPIDLMAEFYKGHGDDPRLRNAAGEPLKVLDPFMGGGTTVVEALRLGFDVTGIDYNPVAWFIVKGMTTPVDLDELQAAFDRLADKVKEPLLDLYRTRCPVTGDDADIIYGFWVKQGICVDPDCGGVTDLFKNYEVARKRGDASIDYLADVACPHCDEKFDWELNRCTITAGGPQIEGLQAAGRGRPADRRYAFGLVEKGVDCPLCGESVAQSELAKQPKKKRKKVPLHVLVDPTTGDFFEVRGKIPDEVTAPESGHAFRPNDGPCARGKFNCGSCGREQRIIDAAEAYGEPLPFRYYGFYAYTPHIGKDAADKARDEALELGLPTNNDKWFAPVSDVDLDKVRQAEATLAEVRDTLPIPDQEIPHGRNFRDLTRQQYKRWSDLFGPRQLLALGMLLKAIGEEERPKLRDALMGAFQVHLDNTSNLCNYQVGLNKLTRVTAGHDYRNPTTIVDNNVWGMGEGQGTYSNSVDKAFRALEFRDAPYVYDEQGKQFVDDSASSNWNPDVTRVSATALPHATGSLDLVISDPPYAGSVQYAEMSDYFYVWLHKVLKDHYPSEFGAEITLKSQEIIEDSMAKDAAWFFEQLTEAWRECHRVLKDDGLLVFTFHHKEGDRWTGLLKSLFDAGFYLIGAYPTHSEALNSIVIQATGGITYDIIHVCRKRPAEVEPIPWSVLRREVRREAREQLEAIEKSGDVLPGPDVWMILLGKALKRFSQHYGRVLDADGEPLDMDEAMARLRVLVREVRGESLPLPAALQIADGLSSVYLLHVAGKSGWTRDGLHIELRGYAHSTDDLEAAGLVAKDPDDRGRYVEVSALERFAQREDKLSKDKGGPLVDKLHRLVGVAHGGQDIEPWLGRWRGHWEELAEGLKYLAKADTALKEPAGMVLRTLEAMGPEHVDAKDAQQTLF